MIRTSSLWSAFLSVIVAVIAVANPVAGDVVVYDNGAGGAAGINDAFSSDVVSGIIGADDFVLVSNTIVTGVEWSGVYAFFNTPPASDSFTIEIYSDSAGAPDSLLSSTVVGASATRTDSGFDEPTFGFDIYEYSASITPFSATAGTTYWVSIFNDTTGDDDSWLWGIINGTGNLHQSNDFGTNWFDAGHQADFRLTAIPEPTGIGLFGLTVICAAGLRRRRNQRTSYR